MIPSQFILLSSFVRHYQLYIKVSTRKIFFRNLSVENFGRIGGDQLSGEVELTIGDDLMGGRVNWEGDQTYKKADRASNACIYQQTFNMAD